MTAYVFVTLVSVVAPLVLACAGAPAAREQSTVSAEQATEARRAIARYLECEECTDGELEAVVRLGEVSVPVLAATLRGGIAPATREKLRLHLVATYEELKKYASTHADAQIPASEDEYVKMYLDNHDALYRIRAATALAAIGGPAASAALKEASAASVRPDVQAAIKDALAKLQKL
jgi:hypothetical protein